MKLLRYGALGQEKPGALDRKGTIRDLSGQIGDLAGGALLPESIDKLKALDLESLPAVEGSPRLGPCVGAAGKFIAIGLNYADHAKESGVDVPKEPVIFMKATSCICGPNDNVVMPRDSAKVDWEVELACVIGKPGKYIAEADARDHIAGFCVVNDVSERAFQLEGTGQWVKGKSADTFGPVGPWLVTTDEVPDSQNLPHLAGGQRPPLPGRQHQDHGLHRALPGQLREPLHEPAERRHHYHRYAAGRRSGSQAPHLPEGRGLHGSRHRRSRRAAPARGRRRLTATLQANIKEFHLEQQ